MTQVFISYSRKDLSFVERLAADLKNAGFDVWYDVSGIGGGARWRTEIENAVRSSQYAIVVLSPDSVASEWVEREFLFASNLKRKIIPLYYRQCDLPLSFLDLNYIDVRGDNYRKNFNEILRALNQPSVSPPIKREILKSPPGPFFNKRTNTVLLLFGGALMVICIAMGFYLLMRVIPLTPSPETTEPVETREPAPIVSASFPTLALSSTATSENVTSTSQSALETITASATSTYSPTPTLTLTVPPATTSAPTQEPSSSTVTGKDGMTLLYVPAGKFTMGIKAEDALAECQKFREDCQVDWFVDEDPAHEVFLDAFWIDQTEVTNAMYAKCVRDGGCNLPSTTSSLTRDSYYGNSRYDNYPKIHISWYDAKAYCEWAGRRLPTEAEWEKAARGENAFLYPWGNDPPDTNRLNYNSTVGDTTEVGKYPSGASPYGALDMSGNVWEWVADWYSNGYYQVSSYSNPLGPDSGSFKVQRGCSFWYLDGDWTTADRGWTDPSDNQNRVLGFRCARSE